jgi:hypothetical protein
MKCKREFCHNEVTREKMTYCSRECAPYGWMCSDMRSRSQLGKKNPKKGIRRGRPPKTAQVSPTAR